MNIDEKINELMQKQFIYRIFMLEFNKLTSKQKIKLQNKLIKEAKELSFYIDNFSFKRNLTLPETLYLIDALYRTATYQMYASFGQFEDRILSEVTPFRCEKNDIIGYI